MTHLTIRATAHRLPWRAQLRVRSDRPDRSPMDETRDPSAALQLVGGAPSRRVPEADERHGRTTYFTALEAVGDSARILREKSGAWSAAWAATFTCERFLSSSKGR